MLQQHDELVSQKQAREFGQRYGGTTARGEKKFLPAVKDHKISLLSHQRTADSAR